MAGKKGKEEPISVYLWLRIRHRMERLGLQPAELARQIGESTSTVSRMTKRETRSVKFLAKVREKLSIPRDELEQRFDSYVEDVVYALATVMVYTPMRAAEWLEDVTRLASLHRKIEQLDEACHEAERVIRKEREAGADISKLLEQYDDLKQQQRELEVKRRDIARLLD